MQKKRKGRKLLILLIIAAILLAAFGTKIVLYINYLLGNDIIVKLSSDQQVLYLQRGQDRNVTFEASTTTNPFCSAECSSVFADIGRGFTQQDSFRLTPGKSIQKQYTIRASRLGTGQELYSFSMQCRSIQTALCHTSEQPTERTILIAVNYDLTPEDQRARQQLSLELPQLLAAVDTLRIRQPVLAQTLDELAKRVTADNLEDLALGINQSLATLAQRLSNLMPLWDQQDYQSLASAFPNANTQVLDLEQSFSSLNNSISGLVFSYNSLLAKLNRTRDGFQQIVHVMTENPLPVQEVNKAIDDFNDALLIFENKNTIVEKKQAADYIEKEYALQEFSMQKELREQTLELQIQLDIAYNALCSISGICKSHQSIEQRSLQDTFDLGQACIDLERLRAQLEGLSRSSNLTNITSKKRIVAERLSQLPENRTNSGLIGNFLRQLQFAGLSDNTTLRSLVQELPESCPANMTIHRLAQVTVAKIVLSPLISAQAIELPQPAPECCAFGTCAACCTAASCTTADFPIIFLHGHALNKDVSFEYSLDAFDKIQNRLEQDGYISAGAISSYATSNIPEGTFGLSNAPITIKASYYFDIYKQPENYVVVQTKSQNIDSYAVRLKEIVETVKRMTGKAKVIIVAHSMGGLVARRYVQIFGPDNVDKLILIVVPNKGIVGRTADYCPIVGERLECDDMNSNSLFMNKLNQAKPNLPIYNIVGTGCKMPQGMGDGVVLEENARLDEAKNYVVNGTCSGIKVLHTAILDIDKYPEVYEYIRNALQS
jgi:uncharacterized alpha/beta hydrolase family protein/uncharacterized protein YoxC